MLWQCENELPAAKLNYREKRRNRIVYRHIPRFSKHKAFNERRNENIFFAYRELMCTGKYVPLPNWIIIKCYYK